MESKWSMLVGEGYAEERGGLKSRTVFQEGTALQKA